MALTLGHIVEQLGGDLHGDKALQVEAIAPLEKAGAKTITFLSNPKYKAQLAESKAACVIVAPAVAAEAQAGGRACIVTPNPYLYFARLTQLWRAEQRKALPALPHIHPSAVVDADADIDATAIIGPLCVVERGAKIGAGTWLKSRVAVGEDCVIGARCILHAGAVIGADGFGFAPTGDKQGLGWEKIEQLGAVRIGDDVEIGANTCIDRGALEDTVIENGVKIDDLVMIAHNVHVGRNTAMAAQVGVAGSAVIGANCTLAGQVGVVGHLSIADNVHISGKTVVARSIKEPGQYTGVFPLTEHAAWEKNAVLVRQLPALRERLRSLEQALEKIIENQKELKS